MARFDGVSEHVACQFTVQSRRPSGSRRSDWATVGTSSARTFRIPRSRKKLPSSSAISKVVLNPLAKRWSDPSSLSSRITASAPPTRRYFCLQRTCSHPKCNTCRVLWYKLSYASVRRCGSSSVHEDQIQRFCVCKNAARQTALHVQGVSHWTPAIFGPYSQVVPSQSLTPTTPGPCNRNHSGIPTCGKGR